MSRRCKVKCKACGKELINLEAYKVSKNNKNIYYCNEEEYNSITKEENDKSTCLKGVAGILNIAMIPPVLSKQINILREFYEYPVILRTFKDKSSSIIWALENRTFNSEFSKYKYIITIIMNGIDDTKKAMDKERRDMEKLFESNKDSNDRAIEIDIMNSSNFEIKNTKNNKSDISEFLFD